MSHSPARDRLRLLQTLLDIEKEEDLRLYHEQVLRRSLKERCETGVAWYPLAIQRVSYGIGEKVVLDVERTTQLNRHHQLSSGSQVLLFGMADDKNVGDCTGVVYSVHENKMRIILATDSVPAWLYGGKVGVNISFDDRTYREMRQALERAHNARDNRLSDFRELLMGNAKPKFRKWDYEYTHPTLNQSQRRAVQHALEAEDIAIVHGPPGTGKTTTLVQIIKETVARERRVLVCAASNTAVDLLALRCAADGMKVVRLGNPARVDEELHYLTLDIAMTRHEDWDSLKKLKREAEDMRKEAGKWKRNFTQEMREKRSDLYREAAELSKMLRTLEDYILHQTIHRAEVVATTLTGASSDLLDSVKFHTVFIDEAAQALTPACWIALGRAERVVFAGDHCQLPPTVKSIKAEREGLGSTLFEEIIHQKPETATMLEEQYRMNEAIMRFSSRQFYHDALKAAAHVRHWLLMPDSPAVEFVDTAGCGFDERADGETQSSYNPEEAHLLLRHLAVLLNEAEAYAANPSGEPLVVGNVSVAVISPYKAQIRTLKEQFYNSPLLTTYAPQVSINTVDGFQGQERDVVYISLVRSNKRGEIGFLQDTRRMNVALTRARKKLVVVGDSGTLAQHPFYAAFLDYMDEIGAYRSAWEWLSE